MLAAEVLPNLSRLITTPPRHLHLAIADYYARVRLVGMTYWTSSGESPLRDRSFSTIRGVSCGDLEDLATSGRLLSSRMPAARGGPLPSARGCVDETGDSVAGLQDDAPAPSQEDRRRAIYGRRWCS